MNLKRILGFAVATALTMGAWAHADGVKKRYLIQFKSPQAFKQSVMNLQQAQSMDGASASLPNLFHPKAVVTQALQHLNMMVVETSDREAVAALRQNPALDLVEEEFFHPAPQPLSTHGAKQIMGRLPREVKETPWGIDAVKAPDAWNKTRGQGARVMVLDTGLDTQHEALISRFEKGRNFTGGDPSDITDQIGHGTHVAGTILADGVSGLVGVAPEAKLLMGKVCSDRGCSSIAVAAGINWAVQERAHVVNMSLGGMFISDGEGRAIRAAEAAGVYIAAASGNDGTGRVSFPAAVETVTAVGAIDSNLVKADFSQWGRELDVVAPGVDVISAVPRGTGRGAFVQIDLGKGNQDLKSLPFVGSAISTGITGELVFAGLGKSADFANANVRGKIALISRGEIPFSEKVNNAINAGAIAVLVFNNAPGLLQGQLTEDGSEVAVPAAMIEQTAGEQAKQMLANGEMVQASLSVEATDYASFQGTSMATPHVAGVAALIRAANPGLTPQQVRELLKTTATPLSPNDENQYGAGLVDAARAVSQAMSAQVPPMLRAAN